MAAAGKYNTTISIYQARTTTSEYGEQLLTYEFERSTKANVLWNSGPRSMINSEMQFPNTYTLIVHSYVSIKDDTHIELQGKMYRVIEYHTESYPYRDKVVKIELINE